jgi:hypothetical protein
MVIFATRAVGVIWGIFLGDLRSNGGDSGVTLVTRGDHGDLRHSLGTIGDPGKHANLWPLKLSGLSGCVVYGGRCDAF